ncbi:hypothetical protein R3P38DRAFT_2788491 [Favolaschia claudopus]|uniref:Uncharacterized protein n=1 Tax=Favolaschia claudopus TaxID=2862362 RepID=A0AAW0AM92_9AGAR
MPSSIKYELAEAESACEEEVLSRDGRRLKGGGREEERVVGVLSTRPPFILSRPRKELTRRDVMSKAAAGGRHQLYKSIRGYEANVTREERMKVMYMRMNEDDVKNERKQHPVSRVPMKVRMRQKGDRKKQVYVQKQIFFFGCRIQKKATTDDDNCDRGRQTRREEIDDDNPQKRCVRVNAGGWFGGDEGGGVGWRIRELAARGRGEAGEACIVAASSSDDGDQGVVVVVEDMRAGGWGGVGGGWCVAYAVKEDGWWVDASG